jgi:hypothetical protein
MISEPDPTSPVLTTRTGLSGYLQQRAATVEIETCVDNGARFLPCLFVHVAFGAFALFTNDCILF